MFKNKGDKGNSLTSIAGKFMKITEKKLETISQKVIDEYYLDPKIKENIQRNLLEKYADEIFYNDLDNYIEKNHVIENLIASIRGKNKIQPTNEHQFAEKNTKNFLSKYKKYKSIKVICSKIAEIFIEIFNLVKNNILKVDPHSDIGKLQCDLHSMNSERRFETQNILVNLESINKNTKQLLDIFLPHELSETSAEGITHGSKAGEEFYKKIKKIESDYQKQYLFQDALNHYQRLLMEMMPSLQDSSKQEINLLICTMYCNIALCYSNLGNYSEAQNSLDQISSEAAKINKRFYLVSALVIVQDNRQSEYQNALDYVNKALDIDPDYKGAFLLQKYLQAYLNKLPVDQILEELDTKNREVFIKSGNEDDIAEYYQYRGLINYVSDRYEEAKKNIQEALAHGYDEAVGKLNMGAILYGQASQFTPKNCRVLAAQVNQKLMLQAIENLKDVLSSFSTSNSISPVKNQALSLYVSACAILGIQHKLSPLDNYLYDGQEYEVQRCLLLDSSEKLREDQVNLLHLDDRLYYNCKLLLDEKKDAECLEKLRALTDSHDCTINNATFYLLLQLCITSKNVTDYWKYRKDASTYGITDQLLLVLDACAYEIEGKIEKSKSIFDILADNTLEDNIIKNTLRFYKRYKFTKELTGLYSQTHNRIIAGELYYDNVEGFYLDLEREFLEQKNSDIVKILEEIPEGLISENCRSELYAHYYIEINDLENLYKCFEKLGCRESTFNNAWNMALTAERIFKYDEALEICKLLKEKTKDKEEKVKSLWLMSDILLLQGKKDESFAVAQEAHKLTAQNPYDPSHQRFMARGMRCGHQEVLADAIEYKHTHPVVVDWLQEIKIPEGPDMGEKFMQELGEILPNRVNYDNYEKEIISYYRRGKCPIYCLLKFYNWDWGRLLCSTRKCKLRISSGIADELHSEQKYIHSEVVIDWITLSVLAIHKCLGLLSGLEKIHINYNSLVILQYNLISNWNPFFEEILTWIQTAPNIVLEADGFVDSELEENCVFGNDFVICCQIAKNLEIPYLYCDSLASTLQSCGQLRTEEDVHFVSIPAACFEIFKNNDKQQSDCLYSLMRNCQFISFTVSTILCQIEKAGYNVTDELIQPFLFCSFNCDMESFVKVYLGAIGILYPHHKEAAVSLSEIILKDTLRIQRQAISHRIMYRDFESKESGAKVIKTDRYAKMITSYIQKILQDVPENITNLCDLIMSNVNGEKRN